MTTAVWIAIILAVVVVSLAIGIPYFLTHRRMNDHFEHAKSEAYLEATGRTSEDVAQGRPGRPWRRGSARERRPASDQLS
jgi:hypothetical protein